MRRGDSQPRLRPSLLVFVTFAWILVHHLAPLTARAECDGPFPSFRNAAPSAQRVLIGEVVAPLGGEELGGDHRTSRFLLRGWSVLDGNQPVNVEIRDLPAQPCAGPIVARPGDEIAIAFGGRDFSPPQVVNAVAWLNGNPPQIVGVETVTFEEVYSLLGLDAPDALPGRAASGRLDLPVIVWIAAIGALAIAVMIGVVKAARS